MEVITLLLFVGAIWVLGALALFAWNLIHRGDDHSDRLALLPLDDNWRDPGAPQSHSKRKGVSP